MFNGMFGKIAPGMCRLSMNGGIAVKTDNGYKTYNFYGISGNLVESDPMYGIYLMKKGFGGEVLELLGEFDYPVNKPLYRLYKTSYAAVRKAKKLKTKIHK